MNIICPVDKNHTTTDPLYCSTCGAKIISLSTSELPHDNSQPAVPQPEKTGQPSEAIKDGVGESLVVNAAAAITVCPDFKTERTDMKIGHCQVCRYNFESKSYNRFKTTIDLRSKSGLAAARGSVNPVAAMTKRDENLPPVAKLPNQRWEILVAVDASLYQPTDPNAKAPNDPEKVFHLETAEILVGRKSESRKIFPDVCVNDPGVSHRHFKFIKDKDDNLQLLDVGSANGTTLNDENVEAGVKKLLRHGDQITIGCWTRITLQLATIE